MSDGAITLDVSTPMCSCCYVPSRVVVSFVALPARDGKPNRNRGAARITRLCNPCVQRMAELLDVARAAHRHRGAA